MDSIGYCVRVDARDGYLDKLSAIPLHKDFLSIVAVKHYGKNKENPHYHLVIQTTVADQAMRVRMRKIFPDGKGNGHLSLKRWDGNEDAISYLFHEDKDSKLLLCYNVSDETIARARARNLEVSLLVSKAKGKASHTVEKIVLDELVKNGFKKEYIGDPAIAKKLILCALRSGKYAPNNYQIKRMVARIQFELCDGGEQAEERLADSMVAEIYRQY